MKNQRVQSVGELATLVATDPDLQEELRKNPAETIAKMAVAPLQSDVWIYRIVVVALGSAVIIAALGAIGLAAFGKSIPELLIALGSGAVGALAGLLAPSPAGRNN
jgi:hypothetical protein